MDSDFAFIELCSECDTELRKPGVLSRLATGQLAPSKVVRSDHPGPIRREEEDSELPARLEVNVV
jgi:hypothetical protein